MDVAENPGYLQVRLQRSPIPARLDRLLRRTVAESEARGFRRVLVDATALTDPLPTADQYQMGVETARALDGRIKLAIVGQPEHADPFFETVARNRGANLRVFADEVDAVVWLLRNAT